MQDQPHPPRRTGALRCRSTQPFPRENLKGPFRRIRVRSERPQPRHRRVRRPKSVRRRNSSSPSRRVHFSPVRRGGEAQHASETILRADLCMEVVGTRGPVRRAGRCAGRMAGNWLVPRAGRSTSTRKARRRLASRRRTPRGSPPGVHPLAGVVSKSGISQRGRGRLPPRAGELSGTLATAAQLVPSRMGRAPSTSLGAPAARIVTATAALRRPPPGADQAP